MNTIKTFKGLSAGFVLSLLLQAPSQAQEIIVDNIVGAKFSITGTWASSTNIAGYIGSNYLFHTAGTEHIGGLTVDNGSAATQATGTWTSSTGVSGFYGGDYLYALAGNGDSTYSWNLGSALPQAGNYQLHARWTGGASRSSNAVYTLTLSGTPSTISVNQQQDGGQWNLLGTYTMTPTQASISLSSQTNGYVVADAFMLVPEGNPTAHVLWKPQVTQVGMYDVYARWTTDGNSRANNAPYTIEHAEGQTTVLVNQRQNNGQWQLLGNFKLNSSSQVRLSSDNSNGYVIADAIRLVLTQADTAAQAYYIHSDHLDTPRLITNGQNQAVWRSLPTTEPFGDAAPEEDPNTTGTSFKFNLRFPGQYFDKETNLSYNYFRDYDPNTGRYVQSDPIGLEGGVNTYGYAFSDPLLSIDPQGLAVCTYSISSHTMICTPNEGGQPITLGPKGVFSGVPGECQNNPKCADNKDEGPIPPGRYKMNKDNREGNEGFWRLEANPSIAGWKCRLGISRCGFMLHPGSVSLGCITAAPTNPKTMRQYDRIDSLLERENGKNTLEVTP